MNANVEIHPAADVFPSLDNGEFDALVEDIRQNGQRDPIVLHNGMILDGRNRYRAVVQLGLEPKFIEWDGRGTPEQFVISKNIMRRHLTTVQRALIVARLVTANQGSHNKKHEVAKATSFVTAAQAAEIGGVNRATVMDAKAILDRGTPEQIEAVQSGTSGLRTVASAIRADRIEEDGQRRREEGAAKRAKTLKGMSKFWYQFRDSIDGVSSLPDVDTVIRSIPSESWKTYGRRATAALDWLTTFQEKFNASDRNGT